MNAHQNVPSDSLRRPSVLASVLGIACLGALLVGTVGCASMQGAPAPSVEVVTNYQPDDIPVPQYFEFDTQRSWAYIKFQDARVPMRSLELTYWGDRPISEIEAWYRQQMPKHDWKFVETDTFGETALRFSKGPEVAEILMKRTPDTDGRYYVTRLVAKIERAPAE